MSTISNTTQNTSELPLTISGRVTTGEKVGRSIGFPTANLDSDLSQLSIDTGVYFSKCTLENGQEFYALTYFGPRMVFGQTHRVLEAFLLDFDQDLYGQQLSVTLLERTRPPQRVESLEELKQLLQQDVSQARLRLAELEAQQVS